MPNLAIYIMGVSGSGKTSIGQLLAAKTGFAFYDADQFHPQSNLDKMKAGLPLTDEDRWPWLEKIHHFVKEKTASNSIIIGCSALKQVYRDQLSKEIEHQCRWIFLKGDYEPILNRMKMRSDHFMPVSLLQSQFDLLEVPQNAITIDINLSPGQIVDDIISKLNVMKEFGIIGLGVMGKSLSRNLAGKGFALSLYNRHVPVTEVNIAENFIAAHPELSDAKGFEDLAQFVSSLQTPRKILMMLPAGHAVDETIALLLPLLSKNDLLIDAGNSYYKDTEKRTTQLKEAGVLILGIGVSGGEEGALKGPSIMAGGSQEGYDQVKHYLESMAAKDNNHKTCCGYIGDGAAGHFVKMVHNGLEYAEMQLLAEVVSVFRSTGNYNPSEIALLLQDQLATNLNSYLLEITIDILKKKEGENWLIDLILDKAGNKGTGSWATIAASELGVPVPTITAALFARYQSEFLTERKQASAIYSIQPQQPLLEPNSVFNAYRIARIINHHQGFHLIETASETFGWKIDLAELARIWTNGCIIRSHLMGTLSNSLKNTNRILLQPEMAKEVATHFSELKSIVAITTENNLAAPCFTSTLQYLLNYTQEQSTANIIQAQRDFFGSHTYERKDDTTGKKYHSNWKTE